MRFVLCCLLVVGCADSHPNLPGPTTNPPTTYTTQTVPPTDTATTTATTDTGTPPAFDPCNDPGVQVWVATDGSDDAACGAVDSPCRTIGHALDQPADAICVRAGTYQENWLAVPSDTWLVSADGDLAARIDATSYSAVRFHGVSNAGVMGFEIYGDWNQGNPGDGLIRVLDSTDITVTRVMVHDAPYDQDCIKVSGQVSGLLLDEIIAWNPGMRTDNTTYQEVVDIFGSGASLGDPPPVRDITLRNSWLFHGPTGGDWLVYSKIYAEQILYENNLFGPSGGGPAGNAAVGIGTGEAGIPDPTQAVVQDAIVRNNVFVGLQGDAAFAVMNADNTWLYNNTFYANSGGLRSVIMLRGNSHPVGPTYVYGNLFLDNQPDKTWASFYWVRDDLPTVWVHDENLYKGNIATTDTPYTGEPGSLYEVDPLLVDPVVPDTSQPDFATLEALRARFGIESGSPALGGSRDVVSEPDHPNWHPGRTDQRWDLTGDPRPQGLPWDIGADQH